MKKNTLLLFFIVALLFLSACGKSIPSVNATPLPSITPTPDPCATNNLSASIKPVNDLTRQFDDYASLASNTPQSQLVQVIPPMQAIRRSAEDQVVPSCLVQMKKYQLAYMDTFLQTLLAFESNANSSILNGGAVQAKLYHDQYTLEVARLLGITVVVPPTNIAPVTTPNAHQTPSATPSSVAITVSNPGPNPINLHVSASLTSQTIGTFNVGSLATAIAKSSAGDWVLIQIPNQPGKTAWVYASLVKFSGGDINSLSVATPAP